MNTVNNKPREWEEMFDRYGNYIPELESDGDTPKTDSPDTNELDKCKLTLE